MVLLTIIVWVFISLTILGGVITLIKIIKEWWNGNTGSGNLPDTLNKFLH